MQGIIFNVKRYSIHDGPGIRVTFFMKGCPLSCWWCHNPEGISPEITCIESVDRIGEKEFRKAEPVGKKYSSKDILEILDKERVFCDKSGGGVSFSGGEPMMQFDFLLEALQECKKNGYHTAVDTSGYAMPAQFIKIFPFTDLFLLDLKHLDSDIHEKFTGVRNDLMLNNYRLIAGSGCDFMIRIPIVPGINDDSDHLSKIKDYIMSEKNDNLTKISLLPFHKTGSSKYRKFKMPYKMENTEQPSSERMQELKSYFSDIGIKVKIGG
jgi:pyruvate formate lyase activating enzyme